MVELKEGCNHMTWYVPPLLIACHPTLLTSRPAAVVPSFV
jgi:hypothetical protein